MVLSWLWSGISNIALERQISKGIDFIFEKKEYKKLLESISMFQSEFIDSEIDRKSFQDFLMKPNIRYEIYQFVYENYSDDIVSEKKSFISNISTKAMSEMNEKNSRHSRPIFKNENLLNQYFNSLVDSLLEKMVSNISSDSRKQLSAVSFLLEKKFNQLYYENEIHLTSEFLTDSLTRSINNLGVRYTSDFNVETQNKWSFECLGKSEDFLHEINRLRVKAFEHYSNLYFYLIDKENYTSISVLNNILSKELFDSLDKEINFSTDFMELKNSVDSIVFPELYWIDELTHEQKSVMRHYIEPTEISISKLIEFLEKAHLNLLVHPYLLVTGKAGIGKSHLLADYAKKFTERGHSTFLFLGTYFYDNSDPANQMMESLRISNSSFKSILKQLDKKSVETGNRSIIFIDALNEGAGVSFWKEKLFGLIKEIQEYSNIGIVLSVRSEYESVIIPDEFKNLNFSNLKHTGLEGSVNESIKAFCTYYKLAYPTVPSFNEEFNNPLFLKMVCQLLMDSNQKKFSSNFSIETIMRHYLSNLELALSSENRMNFDSKRGVLNELVQVIAKLKIESKWSMLEYNLVFDQLVLVGNKLSVEKPGLLLRELISEGLLQIINIGDDKIFLDFQFEKFSDFFLADYIYQNYVEFKSNVNFEDISELSSYFKDEYALRNHYGVLEMLSTIIANHEKKEIFSYLPTLGARNFVFEIVFDSLPYRNSNAISSKFIKFIETNISTKEVLMRHFVTSQFQLSTNRDSPINSKWLHKFLSEKNQQEIDQVWTMNISKYYRTFVSQFAIWYRESYEFTNHEEAQLILLQLGWLLSSTNRYYRDQATLAIVKILTYDSDLIIFFIKSFLNVNDLYVIERAMATIYGATINLTDNIKIKEVSKCVYDVFFDVDKVKPNVLARDYGRQIINYSIYHDSLSQEIDLNKVFPSYDGNWKYKKVLDEDIKDLEKKYDKYNGFHSLTSSMMTNYGRASGMYGDFGRYTFQSTLSPWKEQFDIQDLSNIVVDRCLKLGYSPELFSEFDTLDGRYFDRFSNMEERIGKKYQWIAFYEMLSEISDNFIPYKVKTTYTEEYELQLKEKNDSWLLSITEQNLKVFPKKVVLDKKDNIVKTEKVYQEPWTVNDSYIRDIDVSVIDEEFPTSTRKIFSFSLPNYLTDKWMKENANIEELRYFLSTKIGNEEYYTLSFYNDDKRNNDKSKSFSPKTNEDYTVMGRAVFIKNSEMENLHTEAKENIGNVSSPNTHNILLREYYWGESYRQWEKELSEYDEKMYIHASHCYGWEKAKQYTSLKEDEPNEMLSILMPSKILVDFGNLKMDKKYIWKNGKNEKICFDGRSIGGERVLLGKKEFIDEYCLKNDCSLVWFCYYDKIGLNQFHDSHYYFVKENDEYFYFEQDNKHGYYDR